MEMKKIISKIPFLMLMIAAGCQKGEEQTSVSTLDISIRPSIQTKAVSLGQTDIYAYSFGSAEVQDTEPIKQFEITTEGIYRYMLPHDTKKVIFSNAGNTPEVSVSKTEDSGLLFTRTEGAGMMDEDVLACSATIEDLTAESATPVELKRISCLVTADLKMKSMNGTELNLNDYISSASLALPNQARSVEFKSDGTIVSSKETSTENNQQAGTEEQVTKSGELYLLNLCNETRAFPTADGQKSMIVISLVDKLENVSVMSRTLDYPFLPNKHYKFTIAVKRNDIGFSFSVEDIVEEEIYVDLN